MRIEDAIVAHEDGVSVLLKEETKSTLSLTCEVAATDPTIVSSVRNCCYPSRTMTRPRFLLLHLNAIVVEVVDIPIAAYSLLTGLSVAAGALFQCSVDQTVSAQLVESIPTAATMSSHLEAVSKVSVALWV